MNDTLDINIFFGSFSDLSKIDLSFINIEIIIYKSRRFKKKVESLNLVNDFHLDYDFITKDNNANNVFEEQKVKRYSLMPIDVNKEFSKYDCYHFRNLILSIYPSDFSLVEIIHLSKTETGYTFSAKSIYPFKTTGSYYKNFMFISKLEYNFVKLFIKKFFHSSQNLKYLNFILNQYVSSFEELNPIFQYLSLIICLEAIVPGSEQLTYRLKRNVALICGNDKDTCSLIYNNVNQLYKLRSAVVHGNIKPSYENFKEYHKYLKMLVARLIRELIIHNVSSIEKLDQIITTLGYGQNKNISNNYRKYKYPIVDNITLTFESVEKY